MPAAPAASSRAVPLIVLLIAASVLGLAPILVRLTETGPAAAGFWRFVFAIPLLADHIRSSVEGEEVTVVSPDTGRVRVAEQWADRLGGVPLGFVHKSRDLTVPNKAESKTVVGDVEGRVCVLIDDMIDTGGTIAGAVQILKDAGAKDVIIAATHAVFSDPAAQRLGECGAREVVVTNTLPIPEEKRFETLTVLSIAPLIARAIREVFEDGSVTSLFDGVA